MPANSQVRSKLLSYPSPHPSHITSLLPQEQAVGRVRALLTRSLSIEEIPPPTPIATSAQHASMMRAEVRESSLQRTCMFSRTERHSPEHGLMQCAAYESHDSQRTPQHSGYAIRAMILRLRGVLSSRNRTPCMLCVHACQHSRAWQDGGARAGREPLTRGVIHWSRLASAVSIARARVVGPTH